MANEYHMIGYIREGPQALNKTLAANEAVIQSIAEWVRLQGTRRIILVGLGSSHTSGLMAKPIFTRYCPIPLILLEASELGLYQDRLIDPNSLVISVSRSGERGAVAEAMLAAKQRGALGVAITGSPDSLLARSAQLTLLTQEGLEITFPKTKSVLACTGLLMRLGLAFASRPDEEAAARLKALMELPEAIDLTIRQVEPALQSLMPAVARHELLAVTGAGSNIGVAFEAAIKLQEAPYVPTRGESTISLVHGPTGALDARWLVAPLVTKADEGISQNLLTLVRRFGAHSLCFHSPDVDVEGLCDYSIRLPVEVDPYLSALVFLPPVQLLTYYWTLARGLNPDAPSSMRSILDAILPPGREEPELRQPDA